MADQSHPTLRRFAKEWRKLRVHHSARRESNTSSSHTHGRFGAPGADKCSAEAREAARAASSDELPFGQTDSSGAVTRHRHAGRQLFLDWSFIDWPNFSLTFLDV
eukprot:2411288-Prymnesium_polylepis.1